MMVSFCAFFFPRGVSDGIMNLIESVSEGFPSYSFRISAEFIQDFYFSEVYPSVSYVGSREK